MDRRSFIYHGVRGLGALSVGALMKGELAGVLAADAKAVPGATVETTSGKVRGLSVDGVQVFKGIPFAGSTAPPSRFLPPTKVKPWTGVRETTALGRRCPQRAKDFHGQVPMEWNVMALDEPMDEDCLFLNLWTPGVGTGHKRPVLVWLHGGGFTSGSAGFRCYDGMALAKKHDAILVTINHRLSVFGFTYLAELGGEKYAAASNVGMLDIVASLEWIRDNIAAFGGDPNSVAVFGQSGGAGKVSVLMGMPAAKGLFQRAIVQSGANLRGLTRSAATKSAEKYLTALGVKPDRLDDLQNLSVDQLLAAIPGDGAVFAPDNLALSPVVDGRTLPGDPFDPVAPAIAADVPMLTGTVEEEVAFFPGQQIDPITDVDLHERVKRTVRRAGDAQVDELIAAYKKGRPNAPNTEIYLIISSDATFRPGVILQAERKAAQAKAPVYLYYFTWHSPVHEGKLRAFHTIDIPFAFDDVDLAKSMTGDGPERNTLASRVSSAWVAFAHTGNPNHSGLPNWPAFDTTKRGTMIFDNECKVVDDPYGAEQRMLHSLMGS